MEMEDAISTDDAGAVSVGQSEPTMFGATLGEQWSAKYLAQEGEGMGHAAARENIVTRYSRGRRRGAHNEGGGNDAIAFGKRSCDATAACLSDATVLFSLASCLSLSCATFSKVLAT
ncbi:hypothetical protein MRX96_044451 [Rhipicephalus microplus]